MPTSPFFVANDFIGADLGAKINDALTSATGLNGGPGEVLVVWTTGLPAISTPVTIGTQQTVRFQPGRFFQDQNGSITLRGNGARVTGAGDTSTELVNYTSDKASIILDPRTAPDFQNLGMEVSDLTLYRDTGSSGGVPIIPAGTAVGIDASCDAPNLSQAPMKNNTTLERVRIRDVRIDGATGKVVTNVQTGYGHVYGVVLGPTSYSRMDRSVVEHSYLDNVFVRNSGLVPGAVGYVSQWELSELLLQSSRTGSGLSVVTTLPPSGAGTLQMILGGWTNIVTFQNAINGLRVVAADATAPIQDLRVFGGFFGSDGQSEIYIDTHGLNGSIRDAFIELAGSGTNPNTANGIWITGSNKNVSVTGCLITTCGSNGILTFAENTVVTGCDILTNGVSQTSGGSGRHGVYVLAGSAEVTGSRLGNTPTSALTQEYGLVCSQNASVTVSGSRLNKNTASGVFCNPNSNVTVAGNWVDGNGVCGVVCSPGAFVTVTGNRFLNNPSGAISGTPGASAGNL